MLANGTLTRQTRILSHDDLRTAAPSIFAATPWQGMSERYRFAPTIEVIDILRDRGFHPVRAQQGRTRIPGKGDFTKHMIRLRHDDYLQPHSVGDEFPELVLTNAHDGTSAYRFHSGLWRLACLNGLVVASADYGGLSVRHSGKDDFASRILDATFQIVEETPAIMAKVEAWKAIPLDRPRQEAFAAAALELKDVKGIEPKALLAPRRREDVSSTDGSRDLWRTLNVTQEHLIKGGVQGRADTGRRVTTKPIKAVDADLKTNRALWTLAARMAELMGA